MNSLTKKITRSALIAAVYFGLSMALAPVSYGPLQFRASEALTMLPFIMIEGVWGVTLGCLFTNMFSAYGIYDIVFGTLATLIAAVATHLIKNKWLAALPPILINALVLPLIWYFTGSEEAYIINALLIAASQTVIVYGLGIPLVTALQKNLHTGL